MKVGLSHQQVAQTHGAEAADIVRLFGDQEAAELAHVGLDCEFVELLRRRRLLAQINTNALRASGTKSDLCADTPMLWKRLSVNSGCVGLPSVTRHAAALAVEQRPSALGLIADRLLVAGHKAVEGRIEGDLGALVGRDRFLDIVHRDGAVEHRLE